MIAETTVDDDRVEREETGYFQKPDGRLPLSPVDTDARWRTSRPGKPSVLHYQENLIVDLGGFIVSRGVTHASEGEWKAVPDLLERLPLLPISLAGDTGYNVGQLRKLLEVEGITAYIPIHPRQDTCMASSGGLVHHGDRLICPQGKILRRGAYHKRQRAYMCVARQKDCQALSRVKETCLPPGQKRRFFSVTIYHSVYSRARERNRTAVYQRERFRRRAIAEGTFASLDRLGWDKSRLRGLWKVDCEGYMAALAHNLKKMVRRLGRSIGPPDPASPDSGIIAGYDSIMNDEAVCPTALARYSSLVTWLLIYLRLLPRWACSHSTDFLNGPGPSTFTPTLSGVSVSFRHSPDSIEWLAHCADGAAYPAVRPEIVSETEIAIPADESKVLD